MAYIWSQPFRVHFNVFYRARCEQLREKKNIIGKEIKKKQVGKFIHTFFRTVRVKLLLF